MKIDKIDSDATELQEMKSVADFLYSDNFYFLILADKTFIYHYIWQSSEIYTSYSPAFAMKIVHNTTLSN